MGGTASTRRVTFEADENENITVVKGIRLSENVIDRMKESSPSGLKSQRHSSIYGASVSDDELKRRVAEELALEQAKKETESQRRLKQAKDLERDRAAANEQLTRAILRERISSEEERSKAKHLARQLEEKDRMIKKQDAFYKEQLARLEEREISVSSGLCGSAGQNPPVLPPEHPPDPQLLCSGQPVHALRQPCQAEHAGEGRIK
uniref:MICOS complex subunit MIC19 isoform X4 n=1 Tax=Jaculus jaculus TaxID=51337 RepID=UPI001E1B2863|nr:MICOS complex subunit MIC19 isoform X4 [Jaculus jaculus]